MNENLVKIIGDLVEYSPGNVWVGWYDILESTEDPDVIVPVLKKKIKSIIVNANLNDREVSYYRSKLKELNNL